MKVVGRKIYLLSIEAEIENPTIADIYQLK